MKSPVQLQVCELPELRQVPCFPQLLWFLHGFALHWSPPHSPLQSQPPS